MSGGWSGGRRLHRPRFVEVAQNRAVLVEANQLDAFCARDFLHLRFHDFVYGVAIHEPRVLPIIGFLAKEPFVDRAYNGRLDERRVQIVQPHRHGVPKRVDRQCERGYHEQGAEPESGKIPDEGRDDTECDEHQDELPELDDRRDFREATAEEITFAEGRGADVEHQPFACQAQILAFVGQETAFGEFDAVDFQSRHLALLQLPLDGLIELLRGGVEIRNERIPVAQHLRCLCFGTAEHVRQELLVCAHSERKRAQYRKPTRAMRRILISRQDQRLSCPWRKQG